jgi:hypothetical protein
VALGQLTLASDGILKPISDALAAGGILGCTSGSTTNPLSALDLSALTSLLGSAPLPTGTLTCDSLVNSLLTSIQPVLTQVAQNIGLQLQLGAVSAWCTATPTTVAGDGNVAGLKLVANLAGTPITILDLPVNPAPNTHILTNLDKVVTAIENGVVTQLDNALNGATSPLSPVIQQVLGTINDQVIAQLAPQLAPLEQNILDGVLNAQSSTGTANTTLATGSGSHPTNSVTALDLKVLPVAGNNGINLRIGKVDCGPNYAANAITPTCTQLHNCPQPPPATCQQLHNCPPPHKVPSGLAAGYLPTGPLGMALLGLTVVAAAGAGVTAGTRSLRKGA